MFKKYHLDFVKLTEALQTGTLPSIADIKIEKPPMEVNIGYYKYLMTSGMVRDNYINTYGFSILTKELIDEIVTLLKGHRTIEIGCGSGYLAHLIRENYPDIEYETLDSGEWVWEFPYTTIDHVTNYGTFDFSKYTAVVVSWPTLGDMEIVKVLDNLPSGCILLHCGESRGGCTGVDELYDTLDCNYIYSHELTNNLGFLGIHDTWTLYHKD